MIHSFSRKRIFLLIWCFLQRLIILWLNSWINVLVLYLLLVRLARVLLSLLLLYTKRGLSSVHNIRSCRKLSRNSWCRCQMVRHRLLLLLLIGSLPLVRLIELLVLMILVLIRFYRRHWALWLNYILWPPRIAWNRLLRLSLLLGLLRLIKHLLKLHKCRVDFFKALNTVGEIVMFYFVDIRHLQNFEGVNQVFLHDLSFFVAC